MRKNLFLVILLCVSTFITSCNDDSTDGNITEIIGDEFNEVFYKGALDIKLEGVPVADNMPQKIFITKIGDNLIRMELNNFSFTGINIGDIIVDAISIVKTGDNHTFEKTQNIDLPALDMKNCPVHVIGTIKGKVLEMKITVKLPIGIGTVIVDFKGEKMLVNQSSEAKITSFTFNGTGTDTIIVAQPVINGTDITFIASASSSQDAIRSLVPTITISDKATITPESGIAADFNNAVTYTVTSEDGIYTTTYTVSISIDTAVYSFDEWYHKDAVLKFREPSPKNILSTSNIGTAFLSLYGFKGGVNILKDSLDVFNGSAAKLITFDTRTFANALVPGITSGSLFMGEFDIAFAMTDRLSCTRFGIPYAHKPLRFKGHYKYTSGAEFVDASDHTNIVVVEGKKDECVISAILFEVATDKDVLTGHDVNTSDKVVAVAALADGTDKAEYTSFDIPFTYINGKSYDPSKKYKLTFVCSSSKEGDIFKGAPNSTLWIDQFEIINK